MSDSKVLHTGGCHCGGIRFEFLSARNATVLECNCSICNMCGFQHLIVPERDFTLLEGSPALYQFNTGVAKHYFCPVCGIKPYYIPRSNPDGVSVNFRCIDRDTFADVEVVPFDGQNWEENAGAISHLSR